MDESKKNWDCAFYDEELRSHFYVFCYLSADCFVPDVKSGQAVPPTNDRIIYLTVNQQIASECLLAMTVFC